MSITTTPFKIVQTGILSITDHENLDTSGYLATADEAITTLRKGFNMKEDETSAESAAAAHDASVAATAGAPRAAAQAAAGSPSSQSAASRT